MKSQNRSKITTEKVRRKINEEHERKSEKISMNEKNILLNITTDQQLTLPLLTEQIIRSKLCGSSS